MLWDKILAMGKKAISLMIIGTFCFFAFMSSMYTVNEGKVGVVKRFSEAVSQVNPGLHFKIPFIDSIEEIDIRTRKNVEEMPVATKEQMRATAKLSVNWTVKKEFVLDLYKRYGSLAQFEEKILDPKLRDQAKQGIAKFTAEENINQREKVSALIYANLAKVSEEYPIIINTLQYEDLQLPEKYLRSIDDKQTARNERDAEKFRLEKQGQVAQQLVNTANAEKDAAKARADGVAYKIITEAEAQAKATVLNGDADAKAIKAKAAALKANPSVIDYTRALNWNGVYPTQIIGKDAPGMLLNLK